ncbi:cyclopropane-fatty-acyl-phospholipid synthase family protein [Methanoculleus sp. MH98A]|uniref:SAM-dependent methyltransferase n=1 Tax=Methanoculleus sp. MH98A TaxID=1495314 RepID=UPI00049F283B|nr:class I SAM-dependent methyltransferase [Methanoculleus sp. MH98A]KDE55746.1 hypothetical protein EI28_05255 [Methanoculleus sp. MH98A]
MTEHKDYTKITQEYYDGIAHEMYVECWGGENHHLGIFDETDDFYQAGRKSNEHLLSFLDTSPGCKILDLGSGLCGLPRFIARRTGCHVTALDLSRRENAYAVAKNREEGLEHLITVVEGSYNDMTFEDGAFDILVSQDAMLHSPDKKALLKGCARVLKKEGQFVFSDVLQMPSITPGEAEVINERVNAPYLATFDFYEEQLRRAGFTVENIVDLGNVNLGKSYQAAHDNLINKKEYLMEERNVPEEWIDNYLNSLRFWVEKAFENKLGWGLFAARRL